MRSRYIRFFISSTFADMTKERNILQKLFAKLSEEFAKMDWQIETVDLRWGISQEAGFDNRTMQICKSEIKRCQELSPRPNFIVLLGNRYGWTPLPETIPYKVGKLLKMSSTEIELFNKWYRLDENVLPHGEFVLQERIGRFRDAVIWFDEVEYPLSQMFTKNGDSLKWKIWRMVNHSEHSITKLFGESATAQEINIGALNVVDAQEHVIAYIRNLKNVPDSQKDIFCEKGEKTIQKLKKLKDNLKCKLQEINVFDINTSYEEYSTDKFDAVFEKELEIRIRRVIESAITEYESNVASTEDEIHLGIATEEANGFVGRSRELSFIHQYIIDPDEFRPLWIKGKSGSGKSALLAKVIEQHRDTHRVVCRFCGRTANVLYSHDLDFISNSWSFDKYFKKDNKPNLIILDALNQLDDNNDKRFASLKWLDKKHLKNIKIIVSTTEELKFSQQPTFLKIYMLPNMSLDSIPLVTNILYRVGRTLTKSQFASVKKVIDKSDKSAIYLHILGHYLRTKASWDPIEESSFDIVYLVDSYLKNLTSPEKHGQELVGEALSLLTTDRLGLSDKEMLDLLSRNKYVRNGVEANSFHQIETQEGEWRIPAVLWSRLRYELSPFLRSYSSQAGHVTTIFHDELKSIFKSIYLDEPVNKGDVASQLFSYYKERFPQGDTHALLEIIHSAIIKEATDKELPIIFEAINYLSSELDFLLEKHRKFPQQLNTDFDEVLPFIDGEMRKRIVSLKLSLSSLPTKATNNQCLLYMYSLPANSLLYQLAKGRVKISAVMKNVISDSEPEDPTLYVLNDVGEFPCMSDDGTKVASVFENRHIIRITDVVNPNKSIELESEGEVVELQCDDEMKFLAIRFIGQCQVFDIKRGRDICFQHLNNHGWMSLSADGKTFACGGKIKDQVFKLSEEDGLFYEYFYSNSSDNKDATMTGSLSPSGKVLWLLQKNKKLIRYDIEQVEDNPIVIDDCFCGFDHPNLKKNLEGLYDPWTCIPTCSETRVVCYHDNYAIIWSMDGDAFNVWGRSHFWQPEFLLGKPIIKISRDNQFLLTYGGHFQGPFCCIEKLNDGSLNSKETTGYAHTGVIIANSNFSIGLNYSDYLIVNLPLQLSRYGTSDGDPTGINSLTCSCSGKELAVGFGIIKTREKKKDVLRLSNGKRSNWTPSFKNMKYDIVRHVCISPDGNYIVASNTPNYNWNAVGEMILCSINHNLMASFESKEKLDFTSIVFTKDSHYVISSISDEYKEGLPQLIVLDSGGTVIGNYKINYTKKISGLIDSLCVSEDNRYVFILLRSVLSSGEGAIDKGQYLVYDLISENIVTINGESSFPIGFYYAAYEKSIPLIMTIPLPHSPIYTNETIKNLLYMLYLDESEIKCINMGEYRLVGMSYTGRYIFCVNKKHDLFIQQQFLGTGDFPNAKVLEHIQWVIPALDEAHIYAVTDDFEILLYNIMSRVTEQRAYRGPFYNYHVCSLGLYIINARGDLALFRPDPDLNVNIPASTTFVRRWNLKTKQREDPTAVCPMCGHMFDLKEEFKDILKERKGANIYDYILHSDWENPHLQNHHCPYCGAKLQFTPYIL